MPESLAAKLDLILQNIGLFRIHFLSIMRSFLPSLDLPPFVPKLRDSCMAILTNAHGETIAREKIANISLRFNGLLPKSLTGKFGFKSR